MTTVILQIQGFQYRVTTRNISLAVNITSLPITWNATDVLPTLWAVYPNTP